MGSRQEVWHCQAGIHKAFAPWHQVKCDVKGRAENHEDHRLDDLDVHFRHPPLSLWPRTSLQSLGKPLLAQKSKDSLSA